MAVIFARLRVKNLPHWHTAFLDAAPGRAAHGISVKAIYRDATYYDGIIIVLEAEDLERARDYYESDEQRQRMTRSGLDRPAEMWMAEDVGPQDFAPG